MRGGASASRGGRGPQPTLDKPKREAILDLTKYVNQRIRVKFTGGREGLAHLTPPQMWANTVNSHWCP